MKINKETKAEEINSGRKRETYKGMGEVDDSPSHARRTTEDGKHRQPREEKDQYVSGPNSRIREPFGVPIQIRGRHSLHVQIRHF